MKVLFHFFIVACICILLMGSTKWGHFYQENTPPSDFYFNSFYEWGKSYDEVIDKNGNPDKVIEEPVKNERYNRLDKINTLFYDNVAIQFYVFDYDNGSKIITRKLFQEVNLAGCGKEYKFSKVTCNGVDKLINELGEPSRIEGSSYIYMINIGDMGSSPMTFTVKEGQITHVKWRNFID